MHEQKMVGSAMTTCMITCTAKLSALLFNAVGPTLRHLFTVEIYFAADWR